MSGADTPRSTFAGGSASAPSQITRERGPNWRFSGAVDGGSLAAGVGSADIRPESSAGLGEISASLGRSLALVADCLAAL